MSLLNIKYSEHIDGIREWKLSKVDINSQAMLVVGKNSTGKSRFLTIIRSLTQSISGLRTPGDGHFEASIKLQSGIFRYELEVKNTVIQKEILTLNKNLLLNRIIGQSTLLFFEKLETHVESEFQDNVLAVASRQDSAQHPWFVEFADWAKKTAYYNFSTGFTAERVLTISDMLRSIKDDANIVQQDRNDVIGTYLKAFKRFGESFDAAIISDIRALGFPITEVGVKAAQELIPELTLDIVMLFIKEEGVASLIPQAFMSQGLFRALALIISLNAQSFASNGNLVLIDDVGEGLDFERSSALINMLMEKSEKHSIQILMTTNDRFIMNGVPIEQWCVLEREKSQVSAFTFTNHQTEFEEFKYSGLSNFDFFRSKAFSGALTNNE